MKRVQVIVGIGIALLLLASVVGSFLQPSPVDVARDYCSALRGVPVQNLDLLGYRSSGFLFDNRQTVEFHMKGADPATKAVVELRQLVYFLPWRVVEFREEAKK
jgi:hypothetical protein